MSFRDASVSCRCLYSFDVFGVVEVEFGVVCAGLVTFLDVCPIVFDDFVCPFIFGFPGLAGVSGGLLQGVCIDGYVCH